jgi:hypothetical protein
MHRFENLEVSPTYDEVKMTFSHGPAVSNTKGKDGQYGAVRPRYTVTVTKAVALALAAAAGAGEALSLGGGPLELSNADDFASIVGVLVAPSA